VKKPFVIVIGLVVIAICALLLRSLLHKDAAEKLQPQLTATVERKTVESAVEAAGDIQPGQQVDIKPEVSARILKIHVEEGDRIEAGQLLVELDNTELLTEKASAETEIGISTLELESASRNLELDKRLHEKNLISRQAFDDRKTERDIAERKLVRARQQLENVETKLVKTRVLAPLAGTVLTLPVVEGQVVVAAASVSSGTLLMSVADLTRLVIKCHVNQVDVAKLKPSMPFTFRVDSLGRNRMNGRVRTIAPISTVKNTIEGYEVEMEIIEPDARLRVGMTADVEVPAARVENALTVPVAAVFIEEDKRFAYVQTKAAPDGERRDIEIGLTNIDFAEILSGLAEGEIVALIKPGSKLPGSQ
jgi:RND family efflux transporter MFP subunit